MSDFEDRYTTGGLSKVRLALEARRAVRPTLVIAAMTLLGIAGFAFMLINLARPMVVSSQTVRFAVDDATGVVSGGLNEVRFKGVPAGRIKDVKMVGGRQAMITVDLESKYGDVYRDASAELRPNTALLDMYLNITDRGTPAAGKVPSDGALAPGRTKTGVKVSDVLQTLRADTRARVRTMLDNLGNGLEDRGVRLQQALVEVAPLLRTAGALSRELAAREPQTKRLVHNVGVLTTELGDRDTSLRRLVVEANRTLGTFQRNSSALDATLRELPPTLSAVQSSFVATRKVLPAVNSAVTALQPVADRLPKSLAAVRRLSAVGTPAVTELQTPVRELVPLARALTPVAGDLSQAITTLRPQVPVVNYVTEAVDSCHTGLNGFFQWDASMSKFGDVRGPSPRGNVNIGAQATGVITDPNEYAPQACVPGKAIGGRPARAEDAR